jgi:hypothetical protein
MLESGIVLPSKLHVIIVGAYACPLTVTWNWEGHTIPTSGMNAVEQNI